MNGLEDQDKVITTWHLAFKRCTDFDLWGQPVEAIDGYQRLSKQLQEFSGTDSQLFTDEQKKVLGKISVCLNLRCKVLQNPGSPEGILLEDLKRIGSTLKTVLSKKCQDFPVDITVAQIRTQSLNNVQFPQSTDLDEDKQEGRANGNLLPKPLPVEGMPMLTLRIEKICLKDARQFIDPFITVSVKDSLGSNLMSPQETPVATRKESQQIIFNMDVYIQKWIDSLPTGFAIFFEFKHYKPKKATTSVKCWACMEKDEIKEGNVALELYKKPTDYKRKNIRLLTVKPLFLHIKLLFNV
ncbi:Axin interactor, dorsalization-associated protein [Mizuhopecten yessoensis]|uniref:Axin interactor, dorsalization-associated protein n=1 Tax=Mizuhopecten yessoensis TaxID=6573 RepID=A0A210R680_MIZYE|nr:Axin interactor, dorsalization-associated protein [Mizuhopecten yessoensis]